MVASLGRLLRAVARRLLSDSARRTLRVERANLRANGLRRWLRWNRMLIDVSLRARIGRRQYVEIDEDDLRGARSSDTVFVFGSGYSLNEITTAEWRAFEEHDTVGFNAFYYQEWVRTDFHLLRGGIYGELNWRPHARHVGEQLAGNPKLADTIFLLHCGYLGEFGNQLLGDRLLPAGARIFRYRTAADHGPPTRSFREGVRHMAGTLTDAVNVAYLLGWRNIVLVGVDLYDSRYFWLDPRSTPSFDPVTRLPSSAEHNPVRGGRYDDVHFTAVSGIVGILASWRETLGVQGVELSVYNPRSLLADVMPVHRSERLYAPRHDVG